MREQALPDQSTVVERELALELLGGGFHTGLRKAADHHTADQAWHAIRQMPDDQWDSVLSFVLDGLGSGGVELVHRSVICSCSGGTGAVHTRGGPEWCVAFDEEHHVS